MSASGRRTGDALRRLARLHGIQLSYTDVKGRRWRASPDTLVRVLRALGEPVSRPADAPRVLPGALEHRWNRVLDPVAVAWEGRRGRAVLRLPSRKARGRQTARLRLEDGLTLSLAWALERAPSVGTAVVHGERYVAKALALPDPLPLGYHRLHLASSGKGLGALVVSAPTRAYQPPADERRWGVFVPLHALASARSWGMGDYSDLASVVAWLAARGGTVVGTLPLLPTFSVRVQEPSPYSPVSRLFWSEAFVDVSRIADPRAVSEVRSDLEAARASPLVDYARIASLKRRAVAVDARTWRRSAHEDEELEPYASFRAAADAWGDWQGWEGKTGGRTPPLPAADPKEGAYYATMQRLAADQLGAVAKGAAARDVHLYLDLPIGVHPSGFDTWRYPAAFAPRMSVGAPPDSVFTGGQNWGFPPPDPEGMRAHGYGHFASVLRTQMRFASMLRLDHVMALHRLFWIPHGRPATEGVYVHYRPDELYAILTLESVRNRCVVVGENLGTVPGYVNRSLRRHGIRPLYVVQYETEGSARTIPPRVPAGSVASVNTHDMPPFAAYWEGRDISDRVVAGLFPKAKADGERRRRARTRERIVRTLRAGGWLQGRPTPRAVWEGLLGFLAASPAWAVLVNLEDAWGETEPQNLPGTGRERPNWRRRLRYSLEEIEGDPGVARVLARVDAARKGQITYGDRVTSRNGKGTPKYFPG